MSPKRVQGFTLIELLIVMALVGMLLALSAPRYFNSVSNAKESVLRQDLATMRDAIDKYFGDHGQYPASLEDIVTRRYIRKLPVDPITERADTWSVIAPPDKQAGAVFDVRSGAPGRARDGSDYASW